MSAEPQKQQAYKDPDPQETSEWLQALQGVLDHEGHVKAHHLIKRLGNQAILKGIPIPFNTVTPYANTITPEESASMPEDSLIARNVAAYVRWNAMAMVVKANKTFGGIGGHIATFSSSAVLYEVGQNWFFRGPKAENGGDLIYFQGHSSPGMYARAFVEGRLSEDQLKHFRREAGKDGLSSYPHPWLMKAFWQFPTVSMGIGPINAIYQARFMKYMERREMRTINQTPDQHAAGRKVWAFLGDGETDEPEALGAISLAAREKLDNLIFVVNCNLQRLDGPVRGNGKIVQELEGIFKGVGWNVIKVIWGTEWDPILEKDKDGLLIEKLNSLVDGDFQDLRSKDGAYIRKKLFGSDPRLKELAKSFSDSDLWQMTRGGHDPRKVFAAYTKAVNHSGQPTVILAKTIKGYGMGHSAESANVAHNTKKMDLDSLKVFRDRFHVPLADDELEELPFIKPPEDSEVAKFVKRTRKELGGSVPSRSDETSPITVPPLDIFSSILKGSGERTGSTTKAFVRYLSTLTRDTEIAQNVVPIVPDEARTFGMEGLFKQLGIYAPFGQLYTPEDVENFAWYKEDPKGQILEEGITEAGAISSWVAAGNAYAIHGIPMIPFYIFYSMFGFQRVGDLAWAAGDMRTRGFLLGATSGRTTLNGEGLQHQDGNSHLLASTIPNCLTWDPTFAYELVIILQDGLKRMFQDQEDVFYYITLMNENYQQPAMPEGIYNEVIEGLYIYQSATADQADAQLLGSGTILNEVIESARLLQNDFDLSCNVWSAPGINQLAREGEACNRHNRYHPGEAKQKPLITKLLEEHQGPAIMATDYVKAYPEQLRRFVPMTYHVLGTDGFGRSDTRETLRDFFEVDRHHIAITTLTALAEEPTCQKVTQETVQKALEMYEIDTDRPSRLQI